MELNQILVGLLALFTLYFAFFFVKDLWQHRRDLGNGNPLICAPFGFIFSFLDVIGIGCFATTTMALAATKQMSNDKLLPGTLNVGFAIPVGLEAFIFIQNVEVEAVTLFSLIFAAIVGAALGGRIVTRLSEKKVQTYLGFALLVTAILMAGKQMGLIAFLGTGNTAIGLTGIKLVVAIALNFVFGALMTIGCGLYAPCMVMVFMLGLNPIVAFPIMMGSCAALMPIASKEFISAGDYARKIAMCLAVAGPVGVFISANIVVGMDLEILTWVIIAVVIYTGFNYVRKGLKKRLPASNETAV